MPGDGTKGEKRSLEKRPRPPRATTPNQNRVLNFMPHLPFQYARFDTFVQVQCQVQNGPDRKRGMSSGR
jgi:hypothetical protein